MISNKKIKKLTKEICKKDYIYIVKYKDKYVSSSFRLTNKFAAAKFKSKVEAEILKDHFMFLQTLAHKNIRLENKIKIIKIEV